MKLSMNHRGWSSGGDTGGGGGGGGVPSTLILGEALFY